MAVRTHRQTPHSGNGGCCSIMPSPRPMFGYVNGTLIYNVWNNDFDIIRRGNFLELFKSQLLNENVTPRDLCIFDCANEGIGTADIEKMLDAIAPEFNELEVRVLFNIPTNKKTKYKYKCFPEHMVAHCHFNDHVNSLPVEWRQIQVDKYFLSLQRRASVSRLKFTKQLLDTFDADQYILSCATQPNKWLNELRNLKEAIHPYKLPILVDGIIDSENKQHYHTDVNFFKCFINVITETSSQTDDDIWREIFITEKTFKAFAYRQLPIWFAVPGTVQVVRDLGFDVFDDIINHSYDNEQSEDKRLSMVVNELNSFCNRYPIYELNNMRNRLWERITNNSNLLTELTMKHAVRKHKHILELINGI